MQELELIDLKAAAELLGLKYHTARKVLYEDNAIGYYDFKSKKMWDKKKILEFRDKHFVAPIP